MERLTARDGDMVYFVKDGKHLAPATISSQETRKVLLKLADYEDREEQQEQGCELCNNENCLTCFNQSSSGGMDRYSKTCNTCTIAHPSTGICSNFDPVNYCENCGRKLV